jgi:hypothetical protein
MQLYSQLLRDHASILEIFTNPLLLDASAVVALANKKAAGIPVTTPEFMEPPFQGAFIEASTKIRTHNRTVHEIRGALVLPVPKSAVPELWNTLPLNPQIELYMQTSIIFAHETKIGSGVYQYGMLSHSYFDPISSDGSLHGQNLDTIPAKTEVLIMQNTPSDYGRFGKFVIPFTSQMLEQGDFVLWALGFLNNPTITSYKIPATSASPEYFWLDIEGKANPINNSVELTRNTVQGKATAGYFHYIPKTPFDEQNYVWEAKPAEIV